MIMCKPNNYSWISISCVFPVPGKLLKKGTDNLIIKTVSQATGITRISMISKWRKREVVEARQIAMVMIEKYGREKDHAAIAALFNQTRLSINYAIKTVEDLCDTNAAFKLKLESIQKEVKRINNLTI